MNTTCSNYHRDALAFKDLHCQLRLNTKQCDTCAVENGTVICIQGSLTSKTHFSGVDCAKYDHSWLICCALASCKDTKYKYIRLWSYHALVDSKTQNIVTCSSRVLSYPKLQNTKIQIRIYETLPLSKSPKQKIQNTRLCHSRALANPAGAISRAKCSTQFAKRKVLHSASRSSCQMLGHVLAGRIQNTKYKIQNTKYKIQNTKYKIQNTLPSLGKRRDLYLSCICFIQSCLEAEFHQMEL